MKRTIRLNEKELTTLVKRVINENDDNLLDDEAEDLLGFQNDLVESMNEYIRKSNTLYDKLSSMSDDDDSENYEYGEDPISTITDCYKFASAIGNTLREEDMLDFDLHSSFKRSTYGRNGDNQVSERHFKNKRRY